MRSLAFKKSTASIGMELELQLIDPKSYTLISKSKDLIRNIKSSPYQSRIKPEITQSMIEINSSIHEHPDTLLKELRGIQAFLLEETQKLNIKICGGGTHPFQTWSMQKIFPTLRYKNLSQKYQYLSKMATVFGQHIHIGCRSGDEAIYLTHALSCYVPQLISLAASSPFYQGVDTSFHSSRASVYNAFPLSGVMPYVKNWQEFSIYFRKMKGLGVVSSMKDFYWDIRPKPEFGTIEIRICDTPLTLYKAVCLTAYAQALALYLIRERPFPLRTDLYDLYSQNRFEAARYGTEGQFINPLSLSSSRIKEDILETFKKLAPYFCELGSMAYIGQLHSELQEDSNDVHLLRELYKQTPSFPQVLEKQCELWSTINNKGF